MTSFALENAGNTVLPDTEAVAAGAVVEPQPLPAETPAQVPFQTSALPDHVTRHVVTGTSALGLGMVIERGSGFLANVLAARFAGASTFGAYSLAISTANNISTYAAGQIGSTAARFSGKYPYGSAGYSTLARALSIVSVTSALLAAAGLLLGAGPIAHLLGKPALTRLLEWAVLSAVGMILLECARGFFVGQRRLRALVLLSVLVGVGMITLLPAAAHQHSPVHMIVSQGLITASAVAICLLLARPLGLFAREDAPASALPLGPMLREVWSFGFVQLSGLICSNLAGWWLTTLVARADTTLVQMSFFAIASQLRNLAGIAPGLLTEGSYAVMADPEGERSRTPHQVMALCSFASLGVASLLASVGIIVVPWALRLLYGHTYDSAALATACGLAVAVVHMGNAPAAARLTIVSIRATGVINTVWAVVVAGAASIFFFRQGSAAAAMTIYFMAHLFAGGLVLVTLKRKDHVPQGMIASYLIGAINSALLIVLALVRNRSHSPWATTGLMLAVVLCAFWALFSLGRRYGWLPQMATVQRAAGAGWTRLTAFRRPRHV